MFNSFKSKLNSRERFARRLYAVNQPKSPVVEAFRTLRTNISFATVDRHIKIILIASPIPGEGKSTITANLGIVMALSGAKVLIIDADLRNPVQDQIFSMENTMGLVDVIAKGIFYENVVQKSSVEGLYVITSGPTPSNPAELMASKRMVDFLDGIKNHYDVVLIDSPPIMAVTDTVILASRVDGVALVLRSGGTRLDVANNAIEQIKKVNGRFLGIILNQVSASNFVDY